MGDHERSNNVSIGTYQTIIIHSVFAYVVVTGLAEKKDLSNNLQGMKSK